MFGVELLEALHEAVVAVRRHVHARRAEQDGEAALTTGLPDHRVRRPAALLHEVRADPADVVLTRCLRGQQPVDRHDRHAVLLGVVERRVEAFAVQRGDDQGVDALVDHALDVGDLLVEVRLGIGHDQVDPASLGFVADRLRLGDAERVRFLLGLGEADRGAGQVDLLDAVAGVDVIGAEVARRAGNLLVGTSLGRTGGPGIGTGRPCRMPPCRRAPYRAVPCLARLSLRSCSLPRPLPRRRG